MKIKKEPKHEAWELKQMQSMSLKSKISTTKWRIREWYDAYNGEVYVSFSGGKDSSVLLHMVREMYPDIPVVFVDTGLEWPQVREFALSQKPIEKLRPALDFRTTLQVYGYPVISKEVSAKIASYRKGQLSAVKSFVPGAREKRYDYSRYSFLLSAPFFISAECCQKTKKDPAIDYENATGRKPIIATMACESQLRTQKWLQHGCLAFDSERPIAKPMSFWTEQDVLCYIKIYNLDIASVYGDIIAKTSFDSVSLFDLYDEYESAEEMPEWKTSGCNRTGCIYCGYGVHLDARPNRYELLDIMGNFNLRDYCMRGGAFDSDGMWKPDNRGLGFWFVLEYMNRHGGMNIFIPELDRYMETYGNEKTASYLKSA